MGSGQHVDRYSTCQHARGRHDTNEGSHGSHFCLTASLYNVPGWRPKKTARAPWAAQKPCEAPTPPPDRSHAFLRPKSRLQYIIFLG
jgi:hypothetical protein